MISERKFARNYTSFWRKACPITRRFVTNANLMAERYLIPLESLVEKDRRSLVSETAYRFFLSLLDPASLEKRKITRKEEKKIFSAAMEGASRFLNRLYSQKKLNSSEIKEARSLCDRLLAFFVNFNIESSYIANPQFPGCGIIGTCVGDIIVGKCLFEVKTTSDNFHAPDFRQVIVYLALNYLSGLYDLEKVSFVNPLRGVYFEIDVEDFIISISGYQPILLYSEIEQFLTDERDFMHLETF